MAETQKIDNPMFLEQLNNDFEMFKIFADDTDIQSTDTNSIDSKKKRAIKTLEILQREIKMLENLDSQKNTKNPKIKTKSVLFLNSPCEDFISPYIELDDTNKKKIKVYKKVKNEFEKIQKNKN